MYLAYVMIKRTEENGNQNRFFKKELLCNSKNEILGLQIYEYLENAIADIGDGTIFENIGLKDDIISARGKIELDIISETDNKADDFSFRFENGLIVSVGTVPPAIDSLDNLDKEKEDEKHSFSVGDLVKFKPDSRNFDKSLVGVIFRIIEVRPMGDDDFYYTIKPIRNYNDNAFWCLESEIEKVHFYNERKLN